MESVIRRGRGHAIPALQTILIYIMRKSSSTTDMPMSHSPCCPAYITSIGAVNKFKCNHKIFLYLPPFPSDLSFLNDRNDSRHFGSRQSFILSGAKGREGVCRIEHYLRYLSYLPAYCYSVLYTL